MEFFQKHKTLFTSILTTSIMVILIYLVIIHDPNVKTRTTNHFANSDLVIEDMYEDGGDNYLVLSDSKNGFTVTIKNSAHYDKYQIGETIDANRYVAVHEDGTEEIIYYFSEKK